MAILNNPQIKTEIVQRLACGQRVRAIFLSWWVLASSTFQELLTGLILKHVSNGNGYGWLILIRHQTRKYRPV